jgi:hypothetical protein
MDNNFLLYLHLSGYENSVKRKGREDFFDKLKVIKDSLGEDGSSSSSSRKYTSQKITSQGAGEKFGLLPRELIYEILLNVPPDTFVKSIPLISKRFNYIFENYHYLWKKKLMLDFPSVEKFGYPQPFIDDFNLTTDKEKYMLFFRKLKQIKKLFYLITYKWASVKRGDPNWYELFGKYGFLLMRYFLKNFNSPLTGFITEFGAKYNDVIKIYKNFRIGYGYKSFICEVFKLFNQGSNEEFSKLSAAYNTSYKLLDRLDTRLKYDSDVHEILITHIFLVYYVKTKPLRSREEDKDLVLRVFDAMNRGEFFGIPFFGLLRLTPLARNRNNGALWDFFSVRKTTDEDVIISVLRDKVAKIVMFFTDWTKGRNIYVKRKDIHKTIQLKEINEAFLKRLMGSEEVLANFLRFTTAEIFRNLPEDKRNSKEFLIKLFTPLISPKYKPFGSQNLTTIEYSILEKNVLPYISKNVMQDEEVVLALLTGELDEYKKAFSRFGVHLSQEKIFDLFEADARFLYIDGVIKEEYYDKRKFQGVLLQHQKFVFENASDKAFQSEYLVKRLRFADYGLFREKGYSKKSLLVIAKNANMKVYSKKKNVFTFERLIYRSESIFFLRYNKINVDMMSDFILANPIRLFRFIVDFIRANISLSTSKTLKALIKKLMEKNPTKMLRDVYDEIIDAVNDIIFFSFTDAVKIGVKSDGLSLEYLSNKLKDNKKIVEAAVLNNPAAIKYASERLRKNKKFIRKLAKKNPNVKKYVTVSSLTSYQNEYYGSDYGYGSDDDDDDEGYF